MENNSHCDLCAAKSPGIMPLLRECDCRLAALLGNRRGETISGAAARTISNHSGLSKEESMDGFHIGMGALLGVGIATKMRAALAASVALVLGFAFLSYQLRSVKR